MPPDARPHEQSTPPPQITLQQLSGDTAIVTLSGDHDLATRPRLAAALEAARGQKNLIVDLTPCTFVDSTIIGVLLSAYVTSQLATAQRLEVVGPPPGSYVGRALSVAGVGETLDMHASIAEARAAIDSDPLARQ